MAADRRAYDAAGVSVAAGERAVDLLRARIRPTELDLLGGIGGFAAALALPAGYRQPVLVTATDGVGTKSEIARVLDRLETIGGDLVAMCADDVACHGAQPLYFLDYLALGRVDPERVARLVGGIAAACEEIGCALVGGETAEHPGVMAADAFDLAGFCVGVVERDELLDGRAARAGDVVVGMASSGLHANGYSLVRALVARHELDLHAAFDGGRAGGTLDRGTLGDELLRPTRLYAPHMRELRSVLESRGLRLAGFAHITGGGLAGNVSRAVGPDLGVRIRTGSWPEPPIFGLLARLGGLEGAEMRATFNCGIGMAAIVEPAAADRAIDLLAEMGIDAWAIGDVRPAAELGGVRYSEVG